MNFQESSVFGHLKQAESKQPPFSFSRNPLFGSCNPGANVPWITYEAEAMTINGGTVLGPPYRAVDKM